MIAEEEEEHKGRDLFDDDEERKSGIEDFVRNEIEGDFPIATASFGQIYTRDHRSSNLVRDQSL